MLIAYGYGFCTGVHRDFFFGGDRSDPEQERLSPALVRMRRSGVDGSILKMLIIPEIVGCFSVLAHMRPLTGHSDALVRKDDRTEVSSGMTRPGSQAGPLTTMVHCLERNR